MNSKFLGKYRGVVTGILDPLQIGRIKAQVPDVLGVAESGWALPAVPCSLAKAKGSALPKVGASVWIEFEQGESDRPVWTGCFFGSAVETPPALKKGK